MRSLSVTLLFPPFGVLWGVMFLGERLSVAHLYGGELICLAVWFVLSKSTPKQEPSPASDCSNNLTALSDFSSDWLVAT
ncbi:hypothetical protein [Pseudomonas sp. ML2-2023-6]|uniref:hypothetical protein n=1 Tax=Pseudomonas sp. ML2-2023-6 TaxID=3122376 RepID=UPI0030CC9EAF